ncbi:MAG TPA: bifunctional DedA family/phosphatase PAP2 family protein [Solirubrobacteraceae bacterium]|nr:bifunctional DedA family/phosphatase PAP2 family protein [Solirubrobacteraceae bacterium]
MGGDAVKPVWIVFAVALGAFLVWRRRRLEPTLLAGGALVAVAALVYGLGVVHFPNIEQLLIDVGERLGKWTYVLVGALAFCETGAFIGLIAPGETALLLGGLVAGQGQVDVLTMIAVVWACAVAGDLTSFYLGRRLGRSFMVKHGSKVQITEARLEQVERFFDRHGGKAILIGRFVGLVRAVAPFMAGSSGMPLRRFVPYDVIGAGLWGSTFVVLGYVFWQSFSQLVDYAKKGALALGAVIVLVVAIVWLVRWLRNPENRARMREWMERQAQRPALRPLVAVLAPVLRTSRRPARFVWDRVTPGDLGLELTTLFAVAGVGAFVFVWDLVRIEQDNGLLAGDAQSLRLADRLHMDALVSVAKVVTALGSLPVAIALVALAGATLAWRHKVRDALALVFGLALTYAAVHITKDAVDRPRPARALVDTDGAAYPSAHAAYAVTWVAVAVALSRALPNVASRFAFVTVAMVIAVVVGLSRIYLRAHYLSDVVGGWGLGAAIFALCGSGALVIGYVRNNARAPDPTPS